MDESEATDSVRCVVGSVQNPEKFITIQDEDGQVLELFKWNKDTKKQETLWKKPVGRQI